MIFYLLDHYLTNKLEIIFYLNHSVSDPGFAQVLPQNLQGKKQEFK